jgi:hypothetical protein
MSEPTHLFVCVVLLLTFPYSNSSQICDLNMFPKKTMFANFADSYTLCTHLFTFKSVLFRMFNL